MNAPTYWGEELPSLEAASPNAEAEDLAECISSGRWDAALVALAGIYAEDPVHGTSSLELASAIRLTKADDLEGAVARLHFSLGRAPLEGPQDALSKHLGERLESRDEHGWSALAWSLHPEGEDTLARLYSDGRLDPQWLSETGYEELESLVFERADESGDPGWQALSALVASRDARASFDETTVLAAATPSDPSIPRAWGLNLQVLLALERDAEVRTAVAVVLDRFGDDPRALLEVLDAAAADAELPDIRTRLNALEPEWMLERVRLQSQDTRTTEQPSRHIGDVLPLLDQRPGLLGAADILLPDPPRRTDDEWLERKAQGDAAMKEWLQRWLAIAAFVFVVVSLVWPLL